MRRVVAGAFNGLILAVVLALGPPLAFLMIPAAGFFLPLLPFWSVGVVGLLFVGFLILGRIPHAIGVAVLAIAGALSPLGTLTLWSVNAVSDVIKLQNAASELIAKCATGVVPLKPPSAKYDLIVLDDVDTTGEQNYEAVDTIAVLAGMRVVAIRRGGLDRQFYEASETTASACVEGRDTAKVGVTPRGTQRKMAPLAVDVCLRRTKIADPSRDQAPAIVLRNIAGSGADYCRFTQVVERTASGELELGRAIPPNPVMPKAVAQGSWLLAVLSEVLQQDLSDKALMAHAVKTTK